MTTQTVLVIGRSGVVKGQFTGTARVVERAADVGRVQAGDILVTKMTDVEFVEAMGRATAVVTDMGGTLCHAAIVCNELRKPFLVGTKTATHDIADGSTITVDTEKGEVVIG